MKKNTNSQLLSLLFCETFAKPLFYFIGLYRSLTSFDVALLSNLFRLSPFKNPLNMSGRLVFSNSPL